MNEETLFQLALEQPADKRAAFLEQHCAADDLRQRVLVLLHAHDNPGDFLGQGPVPGGTTVDQHRLGEGPGSRVGPYKLLQRIGEGGMGTVFMAEQTEPVRRMVALKVIKPGMVSGQVIARFEAERQALAMMDHPNIARVLDAGTTDSGLPYFVMELVKGVPITKYCDEHRLTPQKRLALFIPICRAVQHAHQKGVIHRDLKPSNVLVALYDGRPSPKVIDFGVAKATGQKLTDKTLFTDFGAVVGTLEYMSPEQAELNQLDIDTRSDIHALGVLLYELLTGTTPLSRKRLRAAALLECMRIIREEEPPKPSTRLSTTEELASIAAKRGLEPKKLSGLMRGDLDWIVMKCLEKDRNRRYETANGLGMDLERYLADEPVLASPPTARYRLTKFARKYRKALVTVAAFAIILVVGMVSTTLFAIWATLAEHEANRQRIASDEAKREAGQAKIEADKQRDEARFTAYAAGMRLAQRYWEEDNVGRARELLDEVPKEAAGRDLRGFEWYYLHRLCHSEALTLKGHAGGVPDVTGHAGGVTSVAFSPDGQRLASGGRDGTMKIWDSATGKELFSLKGHAVWVTSVAFSPDGQRLASGGGGTVKIWDSATGKELLSLKGMAGSVAFSPDGQRLASGGGGTVKIWDSATGKELLSLKGPAGSVAFSPDGQRLASGSVGTVKIWDSATGNELFSLSHAGYVKSVAFSPDGQRLASGSRDMTVRIWDSATGKELLALKGHAGGVSSVAFSPDGQRLVSGSEDSIVKIWDSATGTEVSSLKGHVGDVSSVAFSPDGQRLASGGFDQTVKIWDSDTAKGLFCSKDFRVVSVAFSPDSQRLALGGMFEGTVKIWDRATGHELSSLKGHTGPIRSVAFSPDGQRLASGSDDQTVKLWDSATGKELFSFQGHTGLVTTVVFSPDGKRLASASSDQTVKLWDCATGKELFSLKGHAAHVLSVAFSQDGQRLASASSDQTVKLWDSATGKQLFSLKGPVGESHCVAFSPDGKRLASGGFDQAVKGWDSATGKELFSLKGHSAKNGTGDIASVAFSPDGQRLASGTRRDYTVKIWDSATGKELLSLKEDGGQVFSMAFSPDGQCLATASGGWFFIWETAVSPEMQQRREANGLVSDLFKQVGIRADVLERLRTAHGLSPAVRREALAAARSYPENPSVISRIALDVRLSKALKGEAAVQDAAGLMELARFATHEKKQFATTAGLFRDSFQAHPDWATASIRTQPDGSPFTNRRYAAGVAAMASAGKGDGAGLKQEQRDALLHQALVWMREELAAWEKRLDGATLKTSGEVVRLLTDTANDSWLAALRDAARFAKQPASERDEFRQLWAASARLYAAAFAKDAKLADDVPKWHRYNAACAATLAGCGQGNEADKLDDNERARLRKLAVEWLRADFAYWSKQAQSEKPGDHELVPKTLKHWQNDTDLTGVRDPKALEKLPAKEREAFAQLWADVAELVKKAEEKPN